MEDDMSRYYPLPQEVVAFMRSADTFTGEFRRAASTELLLTLNELGLATSSSLTDLGMAIRSWLFRGTENAPDEVSRLLNGVRAFA